MKKGVIQHSRHLFIHPFFVIFVLSILPILIYSNTFFSSFQYDDIPFIVQSPRIRSITNYLDFSRSRLFGYLTFQLNYHFGGLSVLGYHLVNLSIHIANGLLTYLLISLLFKTPKLLSIRNDPNQVSADLSHDRIWGDGKYVALIIALLFVSHPVQTQAVTYILQRLASLMALFYLSTLVCYLLWRLQPMNRKKHYFWYAMALFCTLLAMRTKEQSFTLPFMILLVERIFFGSIRKPQWIFLSPFLLTLPIIPFSRIDAVVAEVGFARVTDEISRSAYFFTQFRVILTYMRLLLFPIHQTLDYDYPIYTTFWEAPVLGSFMVLSILFSIALYLAVLAHREAHRSSQNVVYSSLISFGIFWFFLTLSIESSVFPIDDVIVEHRLYLPSIGFILSFILVVLWSLQSLKVNFPNRRFIFLLCRPKVLSYAFCFVLIALSWATYNRNFVWRDGLTLWSDVVMKSPQKARGYLNLGFEYRIRGRLHEAIEAYRHATEIDPGYAPAYTNLGNIYKELGAMNEAIREYRKALIQQPDLAFAHYNLGDAYLRQGRRKHAVRAFQRALQIQPDFLEARRVLKALSEVPIN